MKLMLEAQPESAPPRPVRFGNPLASQARVAFAFGESLQGWLGEIGAIRAATNLWSALKEAVAGDSSRLTRHVKWKRGCVYYDSHPELPLPPMSQFSAIRPTVAEVASSVKEAQAEDGRTVEIIASDVNNSDWLRLFRSGDGETPARYLLQKWVNEKLMRRVSPALLWNARRSRPNDLALYFVPRDLLGAVWLQLAEVVNGNRPLRQCAACKSWIVITAEGTGKRSNRFTCTDACRMKVYYGRKLQARELRRQGQSIAKIAAMIKADAGSVRQWVARPNQAGRKRNKTK